MYSVYILRSQREKRLYIGITQDVRRRFQQHTAGYVASTQSFRPYELIAIEQYATKAQARKREIQIKRSGLLRKHFKQLPRGPIV